jgi:hypothetical protein
VLLAGYRDRGDLAQAPGRAQRLAQRVQPGLRIDLRPVRVRCPPLANQGAGGSLADNDLARLRRGVDACDQRSSSAQQVLDRELVQRDETAARALGHGGRRPHADG